VSSNWKKIGKGWWASAPRQGKGQGKGKGQGLGQAELPPYLREN